MSAGQGYGYKVGDIILDNDLDNKIEKFFEEKIVELELVKSHHTPPPQIQSSDRIEHGGSRSRRRRGCHYAYSRSGSDSSTTNEPIIAHDNPKAKPHRVLFGG